MTHNLMQNFIVILSRIGYFIYSFITVRSVVAVRLCFHRRCPLPPLVDTPRQTPPGQTPPGADNTHHFPSTPPWADTHPPLPCACWDTPTPGRPLQRTVWMGVFRNTEGCVIAHIDYNIILLTSLLNKNYDGGSIA